MKKTELFGPGCEWVFVGCGGTFFMAIPIYSVLLHKYRPGSITVIDPDRTELKNYDRQWPGRAPGQEKAHHGRVALGCPGVSIAERFNPSDEVLIERTEGRPVVAIVNVDNDQARLDVHSWLASRVSDGVMIDSGCEAEYGQSWAGIWLGSKCIHDWSITHPSVGTVAPAAGGGCSPQTAMSNLMTATCSALMIEEVVRWLQALDVGIPLSIQEYEWQIWSSKGEIRLWNTKIPIQVEGST